MPNLQTGVFLFRIALAGIGLAAALAVSACSREKEAEFLLEDTTAAEDGSAAEPGEDIPPRTAAEADDSPQAAEEERSDPQEQTCTVHICGAVNAPGVYELPPDSRVVDAVAAGGGFAPDADPEACNLAQPVTDGCQVYIVTREESALLAKDSRNAGVQAAEGDIWPNGPQEGKSGLVNINTADEEQLKTLPGIGDSKAAAILAWREEHGRFETIEDIMKVSGIKEGAFSKIKDKITV